MNVSDPYNAYAEGNVFSANPLRIVLALYEGAIDSIRSARQCLAAGDTWGRSNAINKAIKLVTELLVSLDHEQGGEISANLKRVYDYVQCRLIDAHLQRSEHPLIEAENLLDTMREGWQGAAEKCERAASETNAHLAQSTPAPEIPEPSSTYNLFSEETPESVCGVSAVF